MTKRQIARQLVDTEAAIKLARKRLDHLVKKAGVLAAELEPPAPTSVELRGVIKPTRRDEAA